MRMKFFGPKWLRFGWTQPKGTTGRASANIFHFRAFKLIVMVQFGIPE